MEELARDRARRTANAGPPGEQNWSPARPRVDRSNPHNAPITAGFTSSLVLDARDTQFRSLGYGSEVTDRTADPIVYSNSRKQPSRATRKLLEANAQRDHLTYLLRDLGR
jgi:hypothetical protein